MSAWKEWQLTGSEESYREYCDECRRDELHDRMADYYEYDEERKRKKRMKSNTSVVWRKSVWDNHFKCPMCGRKLADKKGQPTNNTIEVSIDTSEGRGLACKCGFGIAVFKDIPEMEVGDDPLRGDWSDFLKKAEDAKSMMAAVKEEKLDLHNENVKLRKQVKELESTVRAVKQNLEESRKKRSEMATKYEQLISEQEGEIRRLMRIVEERNDT